MNILVIGNGFDLAHGLPTKYTDFLAFCKMIMNVYKVDERDTEDNEKMEQIWNELELKVSYNSKGLKELFYGLNLNRIKIEQYNEIVGIFTKTYYDEFYKAINNNFWIKYFLNQPMYQKENWIDFESEIRNIITSIDEDMPNTDANVEVKKLTNQFLENFFLGNLEAKKITYNGLIARLKQDLDKLSLALKIYLVEYVEKIKIVVESKDIKELALDGILSFNYTHTYKRTYAENKNIEYDHIHGEADQDLKNGIVIGINEYLPDNRKDKDIEFISFKKFYQRIYNETGCKYKEWVDRIILGWKEISDNIRKNYSLQIPYGRIPDGSKNGLFIFGHSLDITDGDILKEFVLKDNVYTTIFYHNKEAMGQQIANLVKIIGQDELIRRTGGSTKTIEFKQQQDMVEVI